MASYLVLIIAICTVSMNINLVHANNVRKRGSELRDKHLIVAASEFPLSCKITRNATGDIVNLEGVAPLIIEWLSRRFKFQYTIFNVNVSNMEDAGPNLPGLVSYISRKECDVIMSVAYPSNNRTLYLDFVHPWLYSSMGMLIPMPEISNNNIDAVIKPFNFWVWMGLILSIIAVLITLKCYNLMQRAGTKAQYNNTDKNKTCLRGEIKDISMYVLATLLNQGGYISSKKTSIRLVIGGWCLLAFVLLNTYNGILISYVTAKGRPRPIISSLDDLLNDASIKLVVDRGKVADTYLPLSVKGIEKGLGDKLRSYPHSRCNSTQQCVDMVKRSPHHHVYINGLSVLKNIINQDYQQTKKCQLTIVEKGAIGNLNGAGWVLPKNSPYFEEINLGFTMLQDTGFLLYWEHQLVQARPCYNEKNTNRGSESRRTKPPLVRLNMKNLDGAFLLLIVGFSVSALVFVLEIFLHKCSKINCSNRQ